MRTYAAFSLLAIASGTVIAAPTSPDLGRDIGFSSVPNSPDLGNGADMAAFPSMSSVGMEGAPEDTGAEDPPTQEPAQNDISAAALRQKPVLAMRAGMAYRDYEKWLDAQKVSKAEAIQPATATDEPTAQPDSDEPEYTEAAKGLATSDIPESSDDTSKPDGMEESGSKMPAIPGVEKLTNVKTFLGERDGTDALVEKLKELGNQVKDGGASSGSVPPGPSRMRTRRREVRSTIPGIRMDKGHVDLSDSHSKPKQVAAISRKVRRAPFAKPVDDLVLHSNGLLSSLPGSSKQP